MQLELPIALVCYSLSRRHVLKSHVISIGLDASKFHRAISMQGMGEDSLPTFASRISDEERFRNVSKWKPRCSACGEASDFTGLVLKSTDADGMLESGFRCKKPSCRARLNANSLYAQMAVDIRFHISKYYEGWMQCDDASCAYRTRQMSVLGPRCIVPGCRGTMLQEV